MSGILWTVVLLTLVFGGRHTDTYEEGMSKGELRQFRKEIKWLLFPHLQPPRHLSSKLRSVSLGVVSGAAEQLRPVQDGLVYSIYNLKNLTEGEFLFCTAKHNASEEDIREGSFTEKGKCVLYCVSKMRGMWKRDRFDGHLALLEYFSAVVLDMYPTLDATMTKLALHGRKCLTIYDENNCARFYKIAECLWTVDIEHNFPEAPSSDEELY